MLLRPWPRSSDVLEPSGLYYPNRLARAFFIAMNEVMGQTGLKTLLETAGLHHYAQQWPTDTLERRFDFAEMAAIHESLEAMYGIRGGRGLASRSGGQLLPMAFASLVCCAA